LDVKFNVNDPPREFEVGLSQIIRLKDCAHIHLQPDEQITCFTESGAEYDVVRKNWGFYATPSLNGRLQRYNLRAVMIKNRKDQYFVVLVERGKELLFVQYMAIDHLTIVTWMDNSEILQALDQGMRSS
jgi:hypothetical protein